MINMYRGGVTDLSGLGASMATMGSLFSLPRLEPSQKMELIAQVLAVCSQSRRDRFTVLNVIWEFCRQTFLNDIAIFEIIRREFRADRFSRLNQGAQFRGSHDPVRSTCPNFDGIRQMTRYGSPDQVTNPPLSSWAKDESQFRVLAYPKSCRIRQRLPYSMLPRVVDPWDH
jgi:hypothetical protein